MARELGRGLNPDEPPVIDPRGGFTDVSDELPPNDGDHVEEEEPTVR